MSLAEEVGNVTLACRMAGYSRDSFYRFKAQYAAGGEAALQNQSRRKPLLKNRVAPAIEAAVLELAFAFPAHGQARIAATLAARGMRLSPAGVRCVWRRHGLTTMAMRLAAIEARSSLNGGSYSDAQLAAFAKLQRASIPKPPETRRTPATAVTDALE
ncbi:MAG: helix-turn-helix domain-containing protein, partial [Gemmatimonadales bacterium]